MIQEAWMLQTLRRGPHTTTELIQAPGISAAAYRGTISRLRKRGYVITYTPARGGKGVYRLVSEPQRTNGVDTQKNLSI